MKIAHITFAFDNAQVIKWLRERGTAIKTENWKKLETINNKIQNSIKNDQKMLDKLQRPCSVFVTFESEEAYHRACEYNQTVELEDYAHYGSLLGQNIEIQEACEPSDII